MNMHLNTTGRRVGQGLLTLAVGAAALLMVGSPAKAQDASLPIKNITQLTLSMAPVKTALAILFKDAGLNYSIDSSVTGFVTVDLRNVPFDAALRTVLRSVNPPLTYSVDGGVYNIRPKGTDVATGGGPDNNPGSQPQQPQQPQQPTDTTGGFTPGGTTPPTGGVLTPGSYEVIKINYADAAIIASVFGPLPGQSPNIIVPATSNLNSVGGGGGGGGGSFGGGGGSFGGTNTGSFGGTSSGFGGTSSGFGGSTSFGSTGGGFGGTSSFGGRGF